jgi:hypothetical protein
MEKRKWKMGLDEMPFSVFYFPFSVKNGLKLNKILCLTIIKKESMITLCP